MSFAASQSGGTQATDRASLFSSIDSDGDGAITQTELSDGAKTLFDQLRSQLMTSGNETSQPAEKLTVEDLFANIHANSDGSINEDELGTFMASNPPSPPPGEGRGHGGGLFSKIESLLDQYRSRATTETETSSGLSIAA